MHAVAQDCIDDVIDQSEIDEMVGTDLVSFVPGVSDAAWTKFVRAMVTQRVAHVTASNALGMFEMTPRRLKDLGLVTHLVRATSPSTGKPIWVAQFVRPMTCAKFLKSPVAQYAVFCRSMLDYVHRMSTGEIARPADMTLAGALALLHRCGPSGIRTWLESRRLTETEAAYWRAQEAF